MKPLLNIENYTRYQSRSDTGYRNNTSRSNKTFRSSIHQIIQVFFCILLRKSSIIMQNSHKTNQTLSTKIYLTINDQNPRSCRIHLKKTFIANIVLQPISLTLGLMYLQLNTSMLQSLRLPGFCDESSDQVSVYESNVTPRDKAKVLLAMTALPCRVQKGENKHRGRVGQVVQGRKPMIGKLIIFIV